LGVKVKFTLEQAINAHRGSRNIVLHCNLGTGWGWVVNTMPWLFNHCERDTKPLVQEAGWAPGPVWICAENFAPPDCQVHVIPGVCPKIYLEHKVALQYSVNISVLYTCFNLNFTYFLYRNLM
jgi:hypothetical protein